MFDGGGETNHNGVGEIQELEMKENVVDVRGQLQFDDCDCVGKECFNIVPCYVRLLIKRSYMSNLTMCYC